MAKANTYEMDRGGYSWDKRGCVICGEKPEFRAFFYPTFMNGDAEWLGDYCRAHKGTDLKSVADNEVALRYEVGEEKLQS